MAVQATGAVLLASAEERGAALATLVAAGLHLINIAAFSRHKRLRTYLAWMTVLAVVTTPSLRFAARGVEESASLMLWGLPWVIGVATGGNARRTATAVGLFLLLLGGIEVLVRLLPLPPQGHPAWFVASFFTLNALMLTVVTTLVVLPLASGRRALSAALKVEHNRSERLLLNVLPAPIVPRLKGGEQTIADRFDEATVLFADMVGFTQLASRLQPRALVQMLDEIFTVFDDLATKGVEKIKTIGDCYMAAAGIPLPRPDHAQAVAGMAMEMRDAVAARTDGLRLRIGVHSGPVVAGVIGKSKFIYDLWGDAVNVASRMESHGVAGAVEVSAATAALLGDAFRVEPRGTVEVKGKGPMEVFLLLVRAPSPALAPAPGSAATPAA